MERAKRDFEKMSLVMWCRKMMKVLWDNKNGGLIKGVRGAKNINDKISSNLLIFQFSSVNIYKLGGNTRTKNHYRSVCLGLVVYDCVALMNIIKDNSALKTVPTQKRQSL